MKGKGGPRETQFLPQRWSHCDVIAVPHSLGTSFQDFKASKWKCSAVKSSKCTSASACSMHRRPAANNVMHEVRCTHAAQVKNIKIARHGWREELQEFCINPSAQFAL